MAIDTISSYYWDNIEEKDVVPKPDQLCVACQKINLQKLVEGAYELPRKKSEENAKLYKLHDDTFYAKDKSSICDLCHLIWRDYLDESRMQYPKNRSGPVYLSVFADSRSYADRSPFLYVSCNGSAKDYEDMKLEIFINKQDVVEDKLDKTLAELPSKLVIPSSSGSSSCLSLARNWLDSCLSFHTICARAGETECSLPTRLLHVGTFGDKIELCNTQGGLGSWIALSYCWGGNVGFTLTQKTKDELLGGVSLEHFPPTFSDAITITRNLGIKYLWIDALCIFQDSKEDWEAEAPQMAHIYSNAILTIVAESSVSFKDGILKNRPTGSACRLPWSPGSKQTIHLRNTKSEWFMKSPNSTWNSRGWTLQEDILSWRTLRYTKTEMEWTCASCLLREKTHRGDALFKDIQVAHRYNYGWRHSFRYDDWYKILGDYTSRSLSHISDKLPAIGGVAKFKAQTLGDTYLAGFWKSDMIWGLLWEHSDSQDRNKWPNLNLPIYPSWSWISWNGGVRFAACEELDLRVAEYAKVEAVNIDYATPSIYGAVKSAELIIAAPCLEPLTFINSKELSATTDDKFLSGLYGHMSWHHEFKTRHRWHAEQKYAVLLMAQRKSYGPKSRLVFLVIESISASEDLGAFRGHKNGKRFYRRVASKNTEYDAPQAIVGEDWPVKTFHIL
ncbi:heterokaryon incompatibility protein-domain-containing protein [Bisporella sp. PMI_857]|nr:heterokaryon incompatibility protein-domain-containing protein [Bisporella sp. PMI_857]